MASRMKRYGICLLYTSLASRLGEAAIQALMEGQRNVMIGIRNNEIVYVHMENKY